MFLESAITEGPTTLAVKGLKIEDMALSIEHQVVSDNLLQRTVE